MKALRSFTVRPRVPAELAPLEELAMNLRWSWDTRTRELFGWVDPDAWDEVVHDPVRLLGRVGHDRLRALVADDGFVRYLAEVHEELRRELARDAWFQRRPGSPLRAVAYFSPEFGISEAVPQYSGGLGVLAGDHLKACSDLGVPLTGVGLMYRNGYFRQDLGPEGRQEQRYPDLDPHAMALTPVEGVRVTVELAGTPVVARIWRADVGRTPLYLLDTDVDENDDASRTITDRLYGGDTEHRLRQELLLGIGGVRALRAMGIETQVFHTNEGHAGFLGLERMRECMESGLSFGEAVEAVRPGSVFTTHTPVPAGIDQFPRELIEKYFTTWASSLGLDLDDLVALGHRPGDDRQARFNMAVMGFALAARANGVSALHGQVSRDMFADLWPGVPAAEAPIGHVTNGVHARTWVSPEMDDVLARRVHPSWGEASGADWTRLADAPDHELWRARELGKFRLTDFVRSALRSAEVARGRSASEVAWTAEALDPRALTVCFARRFASYKRATLLLSDPDRLRALLCSPERPVQFVFAGKAHPADERGKEMIRQIVTFASDPAVRQRFVFLADYDIAVARTLYHGADVWLNNPRRPQEACGTSGMKAALNGALNLSILDGWWEECFDGENGWAITSAGWEADADRRDLLESQSLYELLENQVVPAFYDDVRGGVPRGWMRRVKASLVSLGPFVSASRMVENYTTELYEPAATHTDALTAEGHARARALAEWKQAVGDAWHGVHIDRVESGGDLTGLGEDRVVEAVVSLGSLTAEDVSVQLVHGPVGQGEEIDEPVVAAMESVADEDGHHLRFRGTFTCGHAGRYGFTVRILPRHQDVASQSELGRIVWA